MCDIYGTYMRLFYTGYYVDSKDFSSKIVLKFVTEMYRTNLIINKILLTTRILPYLLKHVLNKVADFVSSPSRNEISSSG